MADNNRKSHCLPRASAGVPPPQWYNYPIPNAPDLSPFVRVINSGKRRTPTSLCPRRVHPQHCTTVQYSRRYCQRDNQHPPTTHQITATQQSTAPHNGAQCFLLYRPIVFQNCREQVALVFILCIENLGTAVEVSLEIFLKIVIIVDVLLFEHFYQSLI